MRCCVLWGSVMVSAVLRAKGVVSWLVKYCVLWGSVMVSGVLRAVG